jgi:IS1 family transposase
MPCVQGNMPNNYTTSWWLFPPETREVQYDEKWAFVGKKEKNCDPDDPDDQRQGDHWDHVGFDPEHRLVLSVVPGKRTAENVQQLVDDVKERMEGRIPNLITTDEYPAYETAILEAYGKEVVPERTGRPGRPKNPYKVPPKNLKYATVHKTREKGRVVKIDFRVIFGTVAAVTAALRRSQVSKAINTAFVERHNGTDRNRNARKVRKTYCFSKDWDVHQAVTYFTIYTYNFCWAVRTLREQHADGQWHPRTPAMVAGLTDHVWSLHEWLAYPSVQRS